MKFGKFVALLFLLFGVMISAANAKSAPPIAHHGIMDLRQQSLVNGVPLNGQWQFVWKRFLDPSLIDRKTGKMVEFPYRWTDQQQDGTKYPSFGYATYRVTVLLPHNSDSLSMVIPETYSAYKLFLNGQLVSSNGNISTSSAGFVPYWLPKTINIPPGKDTLEITMHLANFVHHTGGISEPIIIGKQEQIVQQNYFLQSFDLLLTGCLLMAGIFFLGLYLVGNRDKTILLFALFCLLYSYRIFGVDNYMVNLIFPNLSWNLTARIEYISLFSSMGVFTLYTRRLYPKDVNVLIVTCIIAICFLFSFLTIFIGPYYYTQLMEPFLWVSTFCILYIPCVYALAYQRKRSGSIYTLMSSIAIVIAFSLSLLYYWGFMERYQVLSFFCYISFFFLQALILSHRVYAALKQARAEAEQGLVVKSEFLSTMSHEIRTPLNAVIGMSHLLLKDNPRPDQAENLNVMLFSANNLMVIINDILDYNKIEAGKIVFESIEMDLAYITNYIVSGQKSAAADKNIDLNLEIDPALKNRIIGDPTRFTQVVTNLLHNAIKFTDAGYVAVNIEVTAQNDTDITLRVAVKDTGIGIPQKNQKLIFERFTQADSSISRSFGGTGLGLAISKRILELQHATLKLSSEEGVGSTFYFEQQFVKGKVIVPNDFTQPAIDSNMPLHNISVLVVDDNPINVMVARKFLERWGATVDVAKDGQEALDHLDITRHRLVLMDLHMPVMNGYDASKKMRVDGVRIPIIALTANLPEEIYDLLKDAGIDDIVVKPFLPDQLQEKIRQYLSSEVSAY